MGNRPKVSAVELAAITAVVREKGSAINRPFLQEVADNEVHVKQVLDDGEKCICRIRGMTYCVCLDPNKLSLATFEPSLFASETGCRIIGHGGVGQMNRP